MAEAHSSPESSEFVQMIKDCIKGSATLSWPIELTRGVATIPLSIDVPFHSSFLKTGVHSYRQFLLSNLEKSTIDVAQLEARYIPNLTARPFEISKGYFENTYRVTGSEVLKKILDEVCSPPLACPKLDSDLTDLFPVAPVRERSRTGSSTRAQPSSVGQVNHYPYPHEQKSWRVEEVFYRRLTEVFPQHRLSGLF